MSGCCEHLGKSHRGYGLYDTLILNTKLPYLWDNTFWLFSVTWLVLLLRSLEGNISLSWFLYFYAWLPLPFFFLLFVIFCFCYYQWLFKTATRMILSFWVILHFTPTQIPSMAHLFHLVRQCSLMTKYIRLRAQHT